VANSPWSAIIADKVPLHQRGLASGFNGLFSLLGTAFGSIVAGIIVNKNDALPLYRNEIVQIFLLIALVQSLFVAYTLLTVKEEPLALERAIPFRLKTFMRAFFFKPAPTPISPGYCSDAFW